PAVFLLDRRQLQLRTPSGQEVQPENPLFDTMVPRRQLQPAGNDFFSENTGGIIGWRGIHPLRTYHQITKEYDLIRLHAPRQRIEDDALFAFHVAGKQFLQPLEFDRSDKRQERVDLTLTPSEFLNLGRHKQWTVSNDTLLCEGATASVDQ